MKITIYKGAEVRELRRKLRLNQSNFSTPFQTTQTRGSRYESSREISNPVNIAFAPDGKAMAIIEELHAIGNPKT